MKILLTSFIFLLSLTSVQAENSFPILNCKFEKNQRLVVFVKGIDNRTLKFLFDVGLYDTTDPEDIKRLEYFTDCIGSGSKSVDRRPTPAVLERARLKVKCGEEFSGNYQYKNASGCTGGAAGNQHCKYPTINKFDGKILNNEFKDVNCHWLDRS